MQCFTVTSHPQAFAHYSRAAAPPPEDEAAEAAAPGAAPRTAAEAAREAVRDAYLAPVLGGDEAPVPVARPADAGALPLFAPLTLTHPPCSVCAWSLQHAGAAHAGWDERDRS